MFASRLSVAATVVKVATVAGPAELAVVDVVHRSDFPAGKARQLKSWCRPDVRVYRNFPDVVGRRRFLLVRERYVEDVVDEPGSAGDYRHRSSSCNPGKRLTL